MTMRAEFEHWYEHEFMGGLDGPGEWDVERNCYVQLPVHMAWKGYQAAYAAGQRAGWATADGKMVQPGDRVWVRGSVGVHETTVAEPVTTYQLFGPIPVRLSYSTKDALLGAIRNRKEQG